MSRYESRRRSRSRSYSRSRSRSRSRDRYRSRSRSPRRRSPDLKRKREEEFDRKDSFRRSPKRAKVLDDDEGFAFDDTEDGWARRAEDDEKTKRQRERMESLRDEPMPAMYSVHKGKVATIKDFGVFVEITGYKRQGLVHVTQISNFRVEDIAAVLSKGDPVWVKVIKTEPDLGKYSLSMKYVSQTDGTDLDPNNIKLTLDNDKRKTGGKFFDHHRIELEAVVNATCTKCGGKGHVAVDCWNLDGKNYALIEDDTGGDDITKRKRIEDANNNQNVMPPAKHEHHHHHHHHHEHKDKKDKKHKEKDKKHKSKDKDKKHKDKDKDKKHKKHKH